MRIGITFGGYCPLHQGHLDLIMQAKKECDRCYVVVCGYDGDPRANELGAPLEERAKAVRHFFEEDEQIRVIEVDDTLIGIDESMSDDNWCRWQQAVRVQMDDPEGAEYVWYVAEPSYKQRIERNNLLGASVVLMDKRLCLSATAIRRHPVRYWQQVAQPFRKYLSHNILVTGTASEGKSTLVRDVARYFGLPYVEEYARTYMQQYGKTDETLDVHDYEVFLSEQNRLCLAAADGRDNPGCMISDTDNLVTLMYARTEAEDPNMRMTFSDYEQVLLPKARQLAGTLRWSKIFLLLPQSAYVDDGFRYMGHAGMAERLRQLRYLDELLADFGMTDRVERLCGSKLENYERVRNYIEGILYDTEKQTV